MRKPWPLRKALLAVLSAALLAGCVTSLSPVRFVPRVAYGSVDEVAVAVGANGYKHYAWTECSGIDDTYTCVLVYTRLATGAVIYSYGVVTPIGTFAQHPDVAVTDSGDAYVVWSKCTDFDDCVDYWTVFRAVNPEGVEPIIALLHTSTLDSEDPPVVEARGTDAYAAYFVLVGGHVRLRYRQLTGGVRLGLIDTALLFPTSPSLAIDSNGDLHAAWVRNPVTDTIVAYGNNIIAPDNFNAATTFEGGLDQSITQPDLALDDDDRAYVAYSLNGADDTIKVRCLDDAPDCYREVATLIVPEVDGGWNIWRNVHLEVITDQPNVVFAATHDSLSYNEIWWYYPPSTGAIPDPTRVTNTTNESEGEPLIVEENSSVGDVPVVAWRMFDTLFAGQSPAGTPDYCYGDVFGTYNSPSNTRQVFTDQDTCDNSGFDLAAHGAWVAGVWTDEESDVIQAHAAWTAFNTHTVALPMVSR